MGKLYDRKRSIRIGDAESDTVEESVLRRGKPDVLIGGRYYDPDIKRYVSPGEPEEAMANAGTVYGINPYIKE